MVWFHVDQQWHITAHCNRNQPTMVVLARPLLKGCLKGLWPLGGWVSMVLGDLAHSAYSPRGGGGSLWVLVYVMVHVHMLCVYVGKTHLAPVQRLRTRGTTATAGAEDSRFHAMLRQTGLHEWTPIPLQYVYDDVEGCFVEREWWFRLKRWALNDNAPQCRLMSTRVHLLLKSLNACSNF